MKNSAGVYQYRISGLEWCVEKLPGRWGKWLWYNADNTSEGSGPIFATKHEALAALKAYVAAVGTKSRTV